MRLSPYLVGTAAQHPNSGVTISTGVDLGQWTAASLTGWGVPAAVVQQLNPFIGLRGAAAVAAFQASAAAGTQITLDPGVAQDISNGAWNTIQQQMLNQYNAANPTVDFFELPGDVQTVIMDVIYNNGSAPNFMSQVASGDWAGAAANLNSFFANGSSNPRLQGDASTLLNAVNSGELSAHRQVGCN